MAITREDVLHIAKLARLDLSEAEVGKMLRDLGSILEHVAELSRVDTTTVAPTATVAVDSAPFRTDVVLPGVARELALAEAARQADGGFAVPGYVDEG
jgi:aspartyl-tRNA(Asn)/glutamyl-tRNA(Gln) amidotransferase subunit C